MRCLLAALLSLALYGEAARAADMEAGAAPQGDAKVGRQVFDAYCAKCHSFDPARADKRGPHLAGLLQRRYAAVAGFPYRMVWPQADPVWTLEQLHAYLEIHRLAEPAIRADLIAFLRAVTGPEATDPVFGDAELGESLFNAKCAYCHSLVPERASGTRSDGRYEAITRALERHPWEPPAAASETVTETGTATETVPLRRGPHLAGLLTRAPGGVAGFSYRFVFDIPGPSWTAADLDAYIAFHARLEPLERADLIAFLSKAAR